jgi:hypothetical protein
VQTVGDAAAAEMRLHDIVWSGLSAALGTHDVDSLVGTDAAALETTSPLDSLAGMMGKAALEQYGIQVVDVRIKRLNLIQTRLSNRAVAVRRPCSLAPHVAALRPGGLRLSRPLEVSDLFGWRLLRRQMQEGHDVCETGIRCLRVL